MEERFRIDGPRFEIARGTKDYPDVFEAVPEPPERLYVCLLYTSDAADE